MPSAPPRTRCARGVGQEHAGVVPAAGGLERLDDREVERADQQISRGHPAEPLAHGLVDEALVLDGRLPRHPSEQTQATHGPSLASLREVLGGTEEAPRVGADHEAHGTAPHLPQPRLRRPPPRPPGRPTSSPRPAAAPPQAQAPAPRQAGPPGRHRGQRLRRGPDGRRHGLQRPAARAPTRQAATATSTALDGGIVQHERRQLDRRTRATTDSSATDTSSSDTSSTTATATAATPSSRPTPPPPAAEPATRRTPRPPPTRGPTA